LKSSDERLPRTLRRLLGLGCLAVVISVPIPGCSGGNSTGSPEEQAKAKAAKNLRFDNSLDKASPKKSP
jgi:hypothetical protein